ncbi:hypothetical protein PLEOSDRAFT_1034309 [Pleurotus ostreatus PC15]|uniref:ribonuclease H n=1 Tax=Pleurotus ostreatus (strain PC15) TaxID=1137138 RepID=A0A067NZG6_PLEO1|nr:hypothetical protein PLEOSDRAFT_1034309 [Pleurotus ostreatus PC15]
MPKAIEDSLQKTIRNFVWGDKKTPVKEEVLHAPRRMGGKELLDIKARNEAIEMMKLKTYLHLGRNRPMWAFFADGILAEKVPKSSDKIPRELRINCFLQNWETSRGNGENKNPTELLKMLKVAKKYGTRIEAQNISKKIAEEMPIWFHAGATSRMNQRKDARVIECLRTRHRVKTVSEIVEIERKGQIQNHKPRRNCRCHHCKYMRDEIECENPHACYKKAAEILERLPAKWDPRRIENREVQPGNEIEDWIKFNNQRQPLEEIKDCLRIFTVGEIRPETEHRRATNDETIKVATDGSCKNANTTEAKAGAGVFFGIDDERNKALRVPKGLAQTNQVGEMYAVLEAVKMNPGEERLEILTDSKYVIKTLTTNLEAIEDRGFIGIANKCLIRRTISALRDRRGDTFFKWVKGHQGDYMNEGADALAGQGCEEEYPRIEFQEVNAEIGSSGAMLQNLDQATAYKGIRESKLKSDKHTRERTRQTIQMIQEHTKDSTGAAPSEGQIWRTLKSKDFSRQIRFFLWMSIHDAYKIGKYWTDTIGGDYTERGLCKHCNNVTEDMAHILTQCSTPGQSEIWKLAENLWTKKGYVWRQPWIGDILACGARTIKDEEGKIRRGDSRFWKILISESAYLIWKMRCARVIQNDDRPVARAEVTNKWRSMMNDRLDLDRKLSHKRYGKKALKTSTVLQTWKRVLENEGKLPRNWIDSSGVLVGSDQIAYQDNG